MLMVVQSKAKGSKSSDYVGHCDEVDSGNKGHKTKEMQTAHFFLEIKAMRRMKALEKEKANFIIQSHFSM